MDIRASFPFLNNKNREKQLIYFDNAATAQKSARCIDAISNYYSYQTAAVHRGIYTLAEESTILYESARNYVADFIGASAHEVIFTSGATAGINYIANSWVLSNLVAGDEIVITELEHHSNILPWILLIERMGIKLKYIPVTQSGLLDISQLDQIITDRTKFVSCSLTSNVIGIRNDLSQVIKRAKYVGAKILVDAAQTVAHESVNVKELGADFLVFSGHKLGGPTGIGVLYIADYLHDEIAPAVVGGGMVQNVDYYAATYTKAPNKFEAGTPAVAQAIGLQAAIEYLQDIDYKSLKMHQSLLCKKLIEGIGQLPLSILGPIEQIKQEGHIVAFISNEMHSHDIAQYLDRYSICVRAGNHCAQILHKKFNINSSVRVSFFVYNTTDEVEMLIDSLHKLLR